MKTKIGSHLSNPVKRRALFGLCAIALVGIVVACSHWMRADSLDAKITVAVSNNKTNYCLSLRNRSNQKMTVWLEEEIQTRDNKWKMPSGGAPVLFQSANSRYLELEPRSQTNLPVAAAYYGKKWRVVVSHQSNGALSTRFRSLLRYLKFGYLTLPSMQRTEEYPSNI